MSEDLFLADRSGDEKARFRQLADFSSSSSAEARWSQGRVSAGNKSKRMLFQTKAEATQWPAFSFAHEGKRKEVILDRLGRLG